MELGALVCTPRAPRCPYCPLQDICVARRLGVQEQRPVQQKKAAIPHHTVTAAVIWREGQVLIAQRPSDGLLGGMWEFPGGKLLPSEDLPACLRREICEELGANIQVGLPLGVYQHAYTHFRITLHAFACTLINGSQPQPHEHSEIRWVTLAELPDYPMGKIDRQISLRLKENK
jgi:A/G-specific adenine glycosylase